MDITMQPMQKHVTISKWCSKKVWNKPQNPTYLFQKLGHSNWKEELYMDTIGGKKCKPILGFTIWNITPQIFETHSTSKIERSWVSFKNGIHLKNTFHFKFYIKRVAMSCNLKLQLNLQNFNFNIWNEWSKKMFQKSNTLGSLFMNTKGTCFLEK